MRKIFPGNEKKAGVTGDSLLSAAMTALVDEPVTARLSFNIIKEPKTRAGYRKVTLPGSCFDLLRSWKMEQKALSLKLGTYWKGNRRDFDENFVFIKDDGSCMNLDTPSHKFREICYNYNRYCDEQSKPEKKLP